MKTKHTDLFNETMSKIVSAINEGLRKDYDHFNAGGDVMSGNELKFLNDLIEKLEDE